MNVIFKTVLVYASEGLLILLIYTHVSVTEAEKVQKKRLRGFGEYTRQCTVGLFGREDKLLVRLLEGAEALALSAIFQRKKRLGGDFCPKTVAEQESVPVFGKSPQSGLPGSPGLF